MINDFTASKEKLVSAVKSIISGQPDFTGQINLELHLRDGEIRDIYRISSRMKIK